MKLMGIVLGISLLILNSCGDIGKRESQTKVSEWMRSDGKVKVLCTTSMIADLVQAVGGDLTDCLVLIQGESDPHSYQLVKGDDEKFRRADIIYYNGLGLEHGPSIAALLQTSAKAYALGDYIKEHHPDDIVIINGSIDPHIWMDVSLWKESIPSIVESLSKIMPQREDELRGRGNKLSERLSGLHAEMLARLGSIPESARYLVTSHEAFNYFARAYLCLKSELKNDAWKERAMAPEGLAPDSQLSTADIQRLIDHIMKYKIATLFSEANVSHDSLKKMVDACAKKGFKTSIDAKSLFADSMGGNDSQAATYEEMMRYDSQVVASGLRRSLGEG